MRNLHRAMIDQGIASAPKRSDDPEHPSLPEGTLNQEDLVECH